MNLREHLQEETARRPEGIFNTGQGDILVRKVGTKNVDAYNLHKGKALKMPLKEFFRLYCTEAEKTRIFAQYLREGISKFATASEVANYASQKASDLYGINAASIEDTMAFSRAIMEVTQ